MNTPRPCFDWGAQGVVPYIADEEAQEAEDAGTAEATTMQDFDLGEFAVPFELYEGQSTISVTSIEWGCIIGSLLCALCTCCSVLCAIDCHCS